MTIQKKVVLARLDLKGCPVGTILDRRDPDQSIEDKYFNGWENALTPGPWWNMPSTFRVVKENEREVLDHMDKSDRCLVTGEPLWQDYTVEAGVRQMLPTSTPNADDEHCVVGRSGIMFRYQTLRHYYFYCLEGYDRLVLYRREDDSWALLGCLYMSVDRARYYKMKVTCAGDRLRCYLDGEEKFNVRDSVFKTGKTGIRTNTMARFSHIEASMANKGFSAYKQSQSQYDAELARIRQKYPQPIFAQKIDLSEYAPFALKIGNLRGKGKKDFLILHGEASPSSTPAVPKLTAIDMDKNMLWQMEYPELKGPATVWQNFMKLRDMDGDGKDEIACITPEKLTIIEGATGKLKAETELPPAGPFMGTSGGVSMPMRRGARITPKNLLFSPYICNLRGRPHPSDILIKDDHEGTGGNTCWAYDDRLNLMWTTTIDQPKFGHHQDFWDVNRDGREEVIMGYYLLAADGEIMWGMEGAEYIEGFHGSRHIDSETMGEMDGDPDTVEVAMAAGPEGFLLVDAETGKVRKHFMVGHAQGISVGKFRPDLPGFQILIGDRWCNYGVLNLFSGDGDKLMYFEPDNVSQGGPPVNWTGTGEEQFLLTSTVKALGMYDGYGRRVVVFPDDEILPEGDYYFRHGAFVADLLGDAREEIAFLRDNTIYIYTQNRPYPKGEKIYAPIRKDYPSLSTPNWKINDIG